MCVSFSAPLSGSYSASSVAPYSVSLGTSYSASSGEYRVNRFKSSSASSGASYSASSVALYSAPYVCHTSSCASSGRHQSSRTSSDAPYRAS